MYRKLTEIGEKFQADGFVLIIAKGLAVKAGKFLQNLIKYLERKSRILFYVN